MARTLYKIPFREQDVERADVRSFYCGPDRWDREAAKWIKQRAAVKYAINKRQSEIWLYARAFPNSLVMG
jgi:hypothetical protein